MRLLFLFLLPSSLAFAASHTTIRPQAATVEPRAVVAPLDRILPEIADGGGVSTSITIINLDSKPADFQLFFFDKSGNALPLAITQLTGTSKGVQGTIPVGGSATLDTAGQGSNTSDGWALLGSPSGAAIGASLVLHFHTDGVPDTEATESLGSLV